MPCLTQRLTKGYTVPFCLYEPLLLHLLATVIRTITIHGMPRANPTHMHTQNSCFGLENASVFIFLELKTQNLIFLSGPWPTNHTLWAQLHADRHRNGDISAALLWQIAAPVSIRICSPWNTIPQDSTRILDHPFHRKIYIDPYVSNAHQETPCSWRTFPNLISENTEYFYHGCSAAAERRSRGRNIMWGVLDDFKQELST